MADKEQVAILRRGANAWNEWRTAHALACPDLAHAPLCGLDLVNVDFSRADLRDADLRGTVLKGARLVGANLAGAYLFKTVLDGADVSGANFVGARFLSCPQLVAALHWESTIRDVDLACGAPIPLRPGSA